MSITYHYARRDGNVETKDMTESVRDFHVSEAQRTYPQSHVMNGVTGHRVDTTTREGATLRVDWLATPDGRAYVWFTEEGETPPKGPEPLGTIWVCQDCMLHHANGECGGCHEGHDEEPLSAIGEGFHPAMGMAFSEHSCGREVATQEVPVPDDTPLECDCETNTYSTSQCEGCGSYLHGERHAMTLFKG